jgi:hypothetical protein
VYQYASSNIDKVLDRFDDFEGEVEKLENADLESLRPGKSLQTISEFKPRKLRRRTDPLQTMPFEKTRDVTPSKRPRQQAFGGDANLDLVPAVPMTTSMPFSAAPAPKPGGSILAEQVRRQNFHISIPLASGAQQQQQQLAKPQQVVFPNVQHTKSAFDARTSTSLSPSISLQYISSPFGQNKNVPATAFVSEMPNEAKDVHREESPGSRKDCASKMSRTQQALPSVISTPNVPSAQHMWSPVSCMGKLASQPAPAEDDASPVPYSWAMTVKPKPQRTAIGFPPALIGSS